MTSRTTPEDLRAILRSDFRSFASKCFAILNPGVNL